MSKISSSSVHLNEASTSTAVPELHRELNLGDLDVLDCPICLEYLRPPVYQCENGHLVCDSCCEKINNTCPSCSLRIGSTRNRAIERIAESAEISCGRMRYGCKEKVSFLQAADHEKICKYTPCICPHCDYIAVPKDLYKHFADEHDCITRPMSFNSVTSVYVFDSVEHVFLQEKEEGILFVLNCFPDPRGSLVSVTCIAPNSSEMGFSYELTARAGERSISLKTWVELTPKLIMQPPKNNCLLVPSDFYVGGFASGEGLKLELIIRKQTVFKQTCSKVVRWILLPLIPTIIVWCSLRCLSWKSSYDDQLVLNMPT